MSTTLVSTPTKAGPPPPSQPSTPTSQTYQPSPGRFRHPRLTEILERKSRTTLTSRNIYNAGVNAGALVLSFVFGDLLAVIVTTTLSTLPSLSSSALVDADTILFILRGFLLLNCTLSLRPAIPYLSRGDDISDIPLTPSQRALLGLPPSAQSTSASIKGSPNFITPPRYRRNSGVNTATSDASASDRRSISANYSSSPLSTSRYTLGFSPSPQQQTPASSRSYRRASGSPFSPSPNGTPLLYKAVTQNSSSGFATNKTIDFEASRSSFNTSTASGFGMSRSQSLRDRLGGSGGSDFGDSVGPGTPSPTNRRAGAGGINYKWLYDKGSRLPKSESMAF